MTLSLSAATIIYLLLVFCRIGGAFIMLPGISDVTTPVSVRVAFALVLSLCIAASINHPVIEKTQATQIILLVCSEIGIGVAIGFISKIILSAMHVLGLSISTQIGFATSMLFDPSQGSQGSSMGTAFTMLILVLLMSMDMHLILIRDLANSYNILPIGDFFDNIESFYEIFQKLISTAFITGIKMSMPFVIINIILYIAGGVISRLMPQLQIFALLMPVQIFLGLIIITLSISSILLWFAEYFAETYKLL